MDRGVDALEKRRTALILVRLMSVMLQDVILAQHPFSIAAPKSNSGCLLILPPHPLGTPNQPPQEAPYPPRDRSPQQRNSSPSCFPTRVPTDPQSPPPINPHILNKTNTASPPFTKIRRGVSSYLRACHRQLLAKSQRSKDGRSLWARPLTKSELSAVIQSPPSLRITEETGKRVSATKGRVPPKLFREIFFTFSRTGR